MNHDKRVSYNTKDFMNHTHDTFSKYHYTTSKQDDTISK